MDLFSNVNDDKKYQPLAERMRPKTLADFAGQEKILRGALGKMIAQGQTPSLIFFGAPGTGKTTQRQAILLKSTRHCREFPNCAGLSKRRRSSANFIGGGQFYLSTRFTDLTKVSKIFCCLTLRTGE